MEHLWRPPGYGYRSAIDAIRPASTIDMGVSMTSNLPTRDEQNPLPKIDTSRPKPPPPSHDRWKWWHFILAGIVGSVFTVYEYFDLTSFERSGETRYMPKPLALVYDLTGKWGVVGLGIAISVLLLFVGIQSYIDEKRRASGSSP